jgi:hypothetical protein
MPKTTIVSIQEECMESIPERITVSELSLILNISEITVKMLVKTGQLPYLCVNNQFF